MVKTLERHRYALCEKHVIVPFCCSYQVYRYLAGCFGLISCRHYLVFRSVPLPFSRVLRYNLSWTKYSLLRLWILALSFYLIGLALSAFLFLTPTFIVEPVKYLRISGTRKRAKDSMMDAGSSISYLSRLISLSAKSHNSRIFSFEDTSHSRSTHLFCGAFRRWISRCVFDGLFCINCHCRSFAPLSRPPPILCANDSIVAAVPRTAPVDLPPTRFRAGRYTIPRVLIPAALDERFAPRLFPCPGREQCFYFFIPPPNPLVLQAKNR